ncbi:flagellar filament capping protein FliD [Rahnella inusitata]|uniref:flagellar filament capping protein FliD n=1 Tax=Rahnella inusitata TaxID=58169 RepID=UPI0039BECD4B
MATITSLGIGSGLDLSTLLTNLSTAEKARLTPITNAQSSNTAKLTAYGTLKSALSTFNDASKAMASADLYKSSTATSSLSSAVTVTTTAGAASGTYAIGVTQLAKAQSLISGVQPDTTTALGTTGSTRTLTIQQGGTAKPLTINLTDAQTSLGGMRDAINNAGGGVTASVLKVSDGSYQLIVSANNSGVNNAMSISVTGDDKLNSVIGYTAGSEATNGMKQSVEAKNAKLTLNGTPIERDSNIVTDAPEGVTLNLLATTTTGNDASVTVTKDTTSAATAITNFVNAYNTLQDSFSSLTKYTAVDANTDTQNTNNGALLGDSVLRDIQVKLKSAISSAQGSGTFTNLAAIGITQDPTNNGNLKIDSTKLTAALKNNTVAVSQLIVGDGKKTGIGTMVTNLATGFIATDGSIETAKTGINNTLKQLTKQYNSTNDSINDTIARYKTSFTALDVAMSKLKNTGDYLTQQFEAMNSSSS